MQTRRVSLKPFVGATRTQHKVNIRSQKFHMCAQPQKATLEQKKALIDSVDCFMYVIVNYTVYFVRIWTVVDVISPHPVPSC